ncbi:MAG: general secretion pathway protein M [Pseudohongiellaceae bacterium]|jgi:general secretion pathway protein M
MLKVLKQNAIILDLQKQYEMLPVRDRNILKIFGTILLLCLIYFAMWVPANDYMDNAQRDLEQNTKLLQLVKQNKALLTAMNRGSGPSVGTKTLSSQQLVSSVSNLAKKHGVMLKRFEPSGDKKIKVWVDNASFDKMITWLTALKTSLNIEVEQISVEKDDVEGQVSSRLTLST